MISKKIICRDQSLTLQGIPLSFLCAQTIVFFGGVGIVARSVYHNPEVTPLFCVLWGVPWAKRRPSACRADPFGPGYLFSLPSDCCPFPAKAWVHCCSFLFLWVGEFISGSAVSEETGVSHSCVFFFFFLKRIPLHNQGSAWLKPPACAGHSLRIVDQWAKELGFLPLAHASRWLSCSVL